MENSTEQVFLVVNNENSLEKVNAIVTATSEVNLQNVEDFSNVCRTCATITEFVIPIFEGEGQQNNLADKIHKHLPIQVTEQDELPRVVCYQCASTLLAWHELVQCCVQADSALKTRVAEQKQTAPDEDEKEQILEKDQQIKWNLCSVYSNPVENEPELGDNTFYDERKSPEYNTFDTKIVNNNVDKPSTSQTKDTYLNFYNALVNFRNHFVAEHRAHRNSNDSESEDQQSNQDLDIDELDDLTDFNMRKDKMSAETKLELNRVQIRENGTLYYCCNICGKKLKSSHTYQLHKRIHTGERPCVCHVCGKQFRTPNGLQRHLTETHERVRRHSCRICSKSFVTMQNLKLHIRIHTGERPCVCTHCGKRFTQSGTLYVHLKTHNELFPYDCAECGAKFKMRVGLERHRLKHTGERPHVCSQCGKGYKQKTELNNHMLLHSNEKPFACVVCGAAFKQRKALRNHSRRVHENSVPASREESHPLVYKHIYQ